MSDPYATSSSKSIIPRRRSGNESTRLEAGIYYSGGSRPRGPVRLTRPGATLGLTDQPQLQVPAVAKIGRFGFPVPAPLALVAPWLPASPGEPLVPRDAAADGAVVEFVVDGRVPGMEGRCGSRHGS